MTAAVAGGAGRAGAGSDSGHFVNLGRPANVSHSPLLLNWFRARGEISAAVVEGFNNIQKLTTSKAYGFRYFRCREIALYHTLGQLPEPKATTDSA